MIINYRKVISFIFVLLFFSQLIKIYYSKKNIDNINNSKKNILLFLDSVKELPVITSDTKDIIEYIDDVENFKELKKKRKFWELIGD
jgi:hypothetical protein